MCQQFSYNRFPWKGLQVENESKLILYFWGKRIRVEIQTRQHRRLARWFVRKRVEYVKQAKSLIKKI